MNSLNKHNGLVKHFMAWGSTAQDGMEFEVDEAEYNHTKQVLNNLLIKARNSIDEIKSIEIDELFACFQAYNGCVNGVDGIARMSCFSRVCEDLGIESPEDFRIRLPSINQICSKGMAIPDVMAVSDAMALFSKSFWYFATALFSKAFWHSGSLQSDNVGDIVDELINKIETELAKA